MRRIRTHAWTHSRPAPTASVVDLRSGLPIHSGRVEPSTLLKSWPQAQPPLRLPPGEDGVATTSSRGWALARCSPGPELIETT